MAFTAYGAPAPTKRSCGGSHGHHVAPAAPSNIADRSLSIVLSAPEARTGSAARTSLGDWALEAAGSRMQGSGNVVGERDCLISSGRGQGSRPGQHGRSWSLCLAPRPLPGCWTGGSCPGLDQAGRQQRPGSERRCPPACRQRRRSLPARLGRAQLGWCSRHPCLAEQLAALVPTTANCCRGPSMRHAAQLAPPRRRTHVAPAPDTAPWRSS